LAAGSSVYLTAKQPIFTLGSLNKFNAALRIGSLGLINPSLTWQHKLSDRVYSSVSTEFVRATGRYKFRATNGIYDTTAVRNNGDIDALRLEAGVNGVLRDSSTWSVKTFIYNSERGLPGAILSNRFNYNQREWDRNVFIQSGYEKRGQFYSLMTHAKYSNDYLRYLDPDVITATGFSDNRYHQQEVYLSLVNQFAINSIWNIAFSTDYQRNTMQANIERFSYPTRHLLLGGLATQLKWSKLNVQANVLGSFLNESTRMFDAGRNYTKYTPAILASWQPFKNNLFRVRGFYKALYRLPTFNELYYTVVGNANLNPEYSQQYDIGFTFQKFNADKILRLLSIQTDVYHNDVNNKIVAIPSQNLRRWTMLNIGSVKINGAETNIKAGWQLSNDVYLNTGISYTYQRARDVTPGSILNQQIPYTPVNSGSLIAGVLWHQVVLNYSFIYTGERYNQKENSPANYVEPWYTHDISVVWQTNYRTRQVKLGLDINNLFNQHYEVITNFPMPGRYYRFKISYNY
jgi:vitamin B12 transporter